VVVEGLGAFDAYANRDSLRYIEAYGLAGIGSMIRGTLRKQGFCEAWSALVQLGLTEDSLAMDLSEYRDLADWLSSFLPKGREGESLRERVGRYCAASEAVLDKLGYLGLFSGAALPRGKHSPAAVLEQLLSDKWKLQKGDLDMVVMQHRFEYSIRGQYFLRTADMVVRGEDNSHTAMAKTVGLPLARAALFIIEGRFSRPGVCIPVYEELYGPMLESLEEAGIGFKEKTIKI
jgi:saccharopine dehydrogenase-like NADP-dependent oxidoreductase